jgi:hypothetical protein
MPTILTPPNLNLWDTAVTREKNDYRMQKFKRNAPDLEANLFSQIIRDLETYKAHQELHWKGNGHNGGGKKK